MLHIFSIILGLILSFSLTFISVKIIKPILDRRDIAGVDGHKLEKYMVTEMGGIAVIIGYTIALATVAVLLSMEYSNFNVSYVAAALGTFILAGLVGFFDDLYKMSHKIKPLLLLACALPLILLLAGKPELNILSYTFNFADIFGMDLRLLYWLIIVPLAVTGAANVVNMLAGFNGLMSSLAIVSCSAMAVLASANGQIEVVFIFTTMVGAQLAFLHYNKYPARIFPGDVGTLSFGALFAAGIVIGNIEIQGAIAFAPQIANASMALLSVGAFFEEKQFRKEKLSALKLWSDGRLSFTRLEKPITLCKVILLNRPQKENELVFKVVLLSFISAFFAIVTGIV
jgi:UDP-N-acetylglucosamine--dolichyl-phosphate N-acetylglucosaminephosphotransferase